MLANSLANDNPHIYFQNSFHLCSFKVLGPFISSPYLSSPQHIVDSFPSENTYTRSFFYNFFFLQDIIYQKIPQIIMRSSCVNTLAHTFLITVSSISPFHFLIRRLERAVYTWYVLTLTPFLNTQLGFNPPDSTVKASHHQRLFSRK